MTGDLVNGLLEVGGAVVLTANVVRLHRDQEVRGVSPWPTAFFTLWGLWNCYFYPANGFMLSMVGGMLLVVVNTIWLGQVFHYGWLRPRMALIEYLETGGKTWDRD